MDLFKNISNVPFGNSIFQIQNFTDGKETPQRRYRHCLLQLRQKHLALKECYFKQKRRDIDIREIKEKLKTSKGFETERLKIDLEEQEFNLDFESKLIEDCIFEIKVYEKIINQLPVFTREEFEQAEYGYWKKRLISDAKREIIGTGGLSNGTIKSLEGIGLQVGRNNENKLILIESNKNDLLYDNKTVKH